MKNFVRLVDAGGTRIMEAWWTGPWPPPERMVLCVGRQSGATKLTTYAQWEVSRTDLVQFDQHIVSHHFQRAQASDLPDDMESPHIARGALYTPLIEDLELPDDG